MTIHVIRAFEARAFESYRARAEDLSIFRVLYATFIICNVIPIAAWLPLAPQAFFDPPIGPAALFTAPPPAIVLLSLNLLLALFATMLLVGWMTSLASAGVGLTLIALDSWAYSLGKINHDILLIVTPLVLGFSGWGRNLSIDSIRFPLAESDQAAVWPPALLALLVGFAMFTAGWAKATTGWLNPQLRCTYGHLVYNYLHTGRETWVGCLALRIDSAWFWKTADWFTVALELTFLPAAFDRKLFRLSLAFASLFHLGVLLLFDIPFSANIVPYGAFVSYTGLPCVRNLRLPDLRSRLKMVYILFVASLTLGLLAALLGESVTDLLRIPFDEIVVWIGAVIGVGSIFPMLIHWSPRPDVLKIGG